MSVGGLIKKVIGLLLALLSPFRRLLCWLGRRRKNSGTLLPLVNHYSGQDVPQSVPSNEMEMEPWDSWGGMDSTAMPGNHHHGNHSVEEDENDLDFFQGMTPEVKRTKKILIKKKEEAIYQSGLSSRLAMTSEVPTGGPDLGVWDDTENSWGEEIKEDLTWEAQAAIREKRRAERDERHMMQQKKKYERDVQRNKRDTHLSAVKLS